VDVSSAIDGSALQAGDVAKTFTESERAVLLKAPRIGPGVVARLEQAGIYSLEMLRSMGVDAALQRFGSDPLASGLANRRRALAAALGASAPLTGPQERAQAAVGLP
jgi:hypothetical protein